MAYSLKKRKQLSKLSKKNKTKFRKAKKTKRTRRFRKQYGGDLSTPQKEYIKEQIKDLDYTDDEKEEVIKYFNDISSHVSKTLRLGNKSSTVLKEFFNDVNLNYQEYINPNIIEKRVILLSMLSSMYYRVIDEDPDTDNENSDTDNEDEDES
jgi:hypothetical protein